MRQNLPSPHQFPDLRHVDPAVLVAVEHVEDLHDGLVRHLGHHVTALYITP